MKTFLRQAILGTVISFPFLGSVAAQEPTSTSDPGGIVVVGTVQDRLLQQELPHALVEFFRPTADDSAFTVLAAQAVADAEGHFRTAGLAPGLYRLQVETLGYQTLDQAVRVEGASPMDITIHLALEAIELDALVVVSLRSRSLESHGFYDRRAQGMGATFTRAEIEASGYMQVTDIIRNARGLTLRRSSPASSPHVVMRAGGSACRPDIILDGVNMGSNLSIDDVVSAGDVEAIEVHRTTSIPPQFRQSSCGAVLLWTRDPHMGGPTRPLDTARLGVAAGFLFLTYLLIR